MRILIVDDSELVRCGISALLRSNMTWDVCGEAASGEEALQKTQDLLPDLVLLDISMPGISGLETAFLVRQKAPNTKIVIMSQHDASDMLPRTLQAGANACVDKARLSVDLVPTMMHVLGLQTGPVI
jgi:DNA-binding NarL/FixJ family response regulator